MDEIEELAPKRSKRAIASGRKRRRSATFDVSEALALKYKAPRYSEWTSHMEDSGIRGSAAKF